ASLQHFLGRPEAIESILAARERKPDGVAIRTIHTRILLESADSTQLEEAPHEAMYADKTAQGRDAKAKRILAMAYLRANQPARAVTHAEAALRLGDLEAIDHLIIAIAKGRLGQTGDARAHLKSAENAWPDELQNKDGHIASAPGGVLWFETAEEFNRLRAQARQALAKDR
ncbi:MAG: hypothetical protein V3W34_17965, partial [Phycisphaerae bacterium]